MSCYRQNSELFQNLLTDVDVLLGSSKDFLLGHWLEAAKALGTTALVSQLVTVSYVKFWDLRFWRLWVWDIMPCSLVDRY